MGMITRGYTFALIIVLMIVVGTIMMRLTSFAYEMIILKEHWLRKDVEKGKEQR